MTFEEQRLREAEESLFRLERQAPLLHYFQPLEPERYVHETAEALRLGRRRPLERLRKAPDFRAHKRIVDEVLVRLSEFDSVEAKLLRERARELELELRLIEARGTASLLPLARERFAFSEGEIERARVLMDRWWSEGDECEQEVETVSLLSAFQDAVANARLPIRVEEGDITASAALGAGVIVVRRGLRLAKREAARIVIHELDGHFERRREDRLRRVGLRVGMPDCDADEEGYAVWLEDRLALLSSVRKKELALRLLLSLLTRDGASLEDLMRAARARGVPEDRALRVGLRVLRGGGLHREIVYLAAYGRVKEALTDDPELGDKMKEGRASIRGLRVSRGGPR